MFFSLLNLDAYAQCLTRSFGEKYDGEVRVRTVYDGDTLKLEDGRKIRLIGINTPEMGRKGAADQPFAKAAKTAVEKFFAEESTVMIRYGHERWDRHGRTLAHLFRRDGTSLEEHLLEEGLATQISIHPNLQFSDCLIQAEAQARSTAKGIWGHPDYRPRQAGSITKNQTGFQLLKGRVTQTQESSTGWLLELDHHLVVFIPKDALVHFPSQAFEKLQNRTLQVRGWIGYRKRLKINNSTQHFTITVSHPSALKQ